MAWTVKPGPRTWKLTRDKDAQRQYTVKYLVIASDPKDGPFGALSAEGLPRPGDVWDVGNDEDLDAYCTQDASVTPCQQGTDPTLHAEVELKFSTQPPQRCQDAKVTDPLLEPMKVSGGGTRYQEEATRDRFGLPIVNSAWEQLSGAKVEFDSNRGKVSIEQNVAALQLALCESMRDTVNQFPLWGMPRRCVKLSQFSWERKFRGQCQVYYTRKFEFDLRNGTFDKDLLDEGQKVLNGFWDARTGLFIPKAIAPAPLNPSAAGVYDPDSPLNPNPDNPAHFVRYKGRDGEPAKAVLDGRGKPYVKDNALRVKTCDQCPDAAPPSYRVSGLGPDLKLLYVDGCTWRATVGGQVYELKYNPPGTLQPGWTFTWDPAVPDSWSFPVGGVWDCRGANVLELAPLGGPLGAQLPPMVAVVPGDLPGRIHVEKYTESDFLFLGIPVDLDVSQPPLV